MTEEEAVNVFDIVVKKGGLPAKLDELVPLSFIGAAAVKFYQAKVKLMDQLGMSEAQRKATLRDGQDAGRMLLDIEARIGELIGKPKPSSSRKDKATGRMVETLPAGIEPRRAYNSRAIASNPAAVAAVIREAEDNEDIPTKTAVLNRIALEKERARHKKAEEEGRTAPTSMEIATDEQAYLFALDKVLDDLPHNPPKNWSDKGMKLARGKVAVIRKRLEAFDEN